MCIDSYSGRLYGAPPPTPHFKILLGLIPFHKFVQCADTNYDIQISYHDDVIKCLPDVKHNQNSNQTLLKEPCLPHCTVSSDIKCETMSY